MIATDTTLSKPSCRKVAHTQYIFPPRPEGCLPIQETGFLATTPENGLGYLAQLKYNDSRCLIKILPGGSIELWNRHGEKFRAYRETDELAHQLNDLRMKLGLDLNHWHLLDGGLLDHKHQAIKDTIAIWDVLVLNSQHLLGISYLERYTWLRDHAITSNSDGTLPSWHYTHKSKVGTDISYDLGFKISTNLLMPKCYPSDFNAWIAIWDNLITPINAPFTVGKVNSKNYSCHPLIEGLVFKQPGAVLEPGFREKNNGGWMVRSRVTTGRHAF